MAGPTIAVLSPLKIDDAKKEEITNIIKKVSDSSSGESFEINGHDFFWDTGEEYEGEIDEYKTLYSFLGWIPKDIIAVVAMVNSPQDHLNIAKIAYEILQSVNGVISYGGDLHDYTSDKNIIDHAGIKYLEIEGLAGLETIFDSDAFSAWMEHKDFRLVK